MLLLMIIHTNGLKSSDLCKRAKYTKCETYTCGSKFCSIDYKTCYNFNLWTKLMNKYSDELPKTYAKFINDIHRCKSSKEEYRNQW